LGFLRVSGQLRLGQLRIAKPSLLGASSSSVVNNFWS